MADSKVCIVFAADFGDALRDLDAQCGPEANSAW